MIEYQILAKKFDDQIFYTAQKRKQFSKIGGTHFFWSKWEDMKPKWHLSYEDAEKLTIQDSQIPKVL